MFARSVRAAAAALALVAATSVVAEAQDTKGFGVTAGLALPTGDLADPGEAGLGFTVGGQYSMPLQNALGLRFNVDYTRFGVDAAGFDGSYSNLGGMANLVYNLNTGTGLKPYLFGGLGYGNFTADIDGFGSNSEAGLAFNIGAGYNFQMSGRNLFAEIRYVSQDVDGDNVTYLPIVIGLRF